MQEQATNLIDSLKRLYASIRAVRRLVDDAILPGHPKKQSILVESSAALDECSRASRSAECLRECIGLQSEDAEVGEK